MESLKPYPVYKDSGAQWLGAVPSHWRILPNRALFEEVKERDRPDAQMLSVTIARGVIRQSEHLQNGSKRDSSKEDKSAYKLVRAGDIVYNKMRAWQGAIGVSDSEGIVSPAYVVQRLRAAALPRYYHYLFRTPAFITEAERSSYGIASDMWSLRPEHFRLILTCVPPLAEQTSIVRYLDYLDRRIRRYIRAKLRVIGLLEDQKRDIISQAVLGRIDVRTGKRYAAYADAALPSVGAIPRHWECGPLKRRWSVTDCKHVTVPFLEEGIPLAGLREAQSFVLSLDDAKRTSLDWYETLVEGGREPKRGDLIYCRNVSVGACAIVDTDERMAMGQDVCLLRSRRENQRYLNYFLHSQAIADQLAALSIGSTFSRINVADVKSLVVAVPPREEQDAIAGHLDAATALIDSRIAIERRQIALTREYQARLISDVVAGKVDVREAAAQLPCELDESELLDNPDALAGHEQADWEGDLDAAPEEVEA